MSLTVVVVFSLALVQLPEVFGQTFCTGGVLPCVANAECNAATDRCECSSGFFGDGRVSCNPNTRCTCTALADPNFGLFDTQASVQKVKANLPCSVVMLGQELILGSPNCVINQVLAHPEVRGSGSGANLRVFVRELEVQLLLPAVTFVVDISGTSVTSGSAGSVASTVNSDSFRTATVADCFNLQVGYNGTYGGAYIDTIARTYGAGGLCGDCDNTADENVGATNITNLAYYLKFIAPLASQKGPFATQCGQIQSDVAASCSDAELDLAADVCGRYLSPFGVCLIEDAAAVGVTDFTSLLTSRFIPCLQGICTAGTAAAQCAVLAAAATTDCTLGPVPAACV